MHYDYNWIMNANLKYILSTLLLSQIQFQYISFVISRLDLMMKISFKKEMLFSILLKNYSKNIHILYNYI